MLLFKGMFTNIGLSWLLNLIQQQQGHFRSIIFYRGEKKTESVPEVPEQHLCLQFAKSGKPVTSQADYCVNTSQVQNSLSLLQLRNDLRGEVHSGGNPFSKTNSLILASDFETLN